MDKNGESNALARHAYLRFLGTPVVERDGERIPGFESRKALALLGYLAVRDKPVSRSQLAELFWEGQSEAQGRGNLRQVLHKLAVALPGCLTVERQIVQFARSASFWVDLHAFDALLAQEDIASMAQAVELYRGELMAGLFLDDCTEFEAWLVTEREHWRQRIVRALTTLVAHATEQHAWESGLRFADRLLALDPWQETAHRQKMSALAHMGQRAAALAQYETCRRILTEEIGVAPSAETTALYERIRAGLYDKASNDEAGAQGRVDETTAVAPILATPAALRNAPHNLPTPPTALLGRDEDLAQAKALLTTPSCRLLTLTGPPGIGKTRMSIQVARELLSEFEDGIRFVDLAPISQPGLVADMIARALGIREVASQPLFETLQAYLQGRQMLLVLDNFEQVLAAAPLVAEVMAAPGCDRLKALVTSRAALRVRGEHEFELQPLALPAPQRLADATTLAHSPAVQLFAQRARAVKAGFVLTDDNTGTIAEICTRLDGLPLAIELAAARVKLLAPTTILNRLRTSDTPGSLQLLTGGARDLPPRQQTLRAAIAWSHDLLDGAEQCLFRRLGVFVGGWTLETAEAVCGIAPLQPEDVLEGLTSLVDKSLVRQSRSHTGEPRFSMLETVREFAQEQLVAGDEGEAMRWQHAHVFTQLAEAWERKIYGPEQSAALNTFEAEHDNLRAALRWFLQARKAQADARSADAHIAEVGLRLATSVAAFWYPRGYLREGRDWLELALSDTAADTPARGNALILAGLLAFRQADFAAARALESQSLFLWRRLGDRYGVARCLTALSYVAADEGDYDAAREMLEESIVTLRNIGDRWTLGLALHVLGLCCSQSGDFSLAGSLFEESLTLLRATGDASRIALPLGAAGRVAYGQGDLEGARIKLDEALALLEAVGDRPQMAATLFWLGQVAWLQGDSSTAMMRYQAGLKLADDVAVKAIIPELLEGLAGVSVTQGIDGASRSARLLGAAEALRGTLNLPLAHVDRNDYDRTIAAVRAQLDETTFTVEWTKGQVMTLRDAIADALEETSDG